MLKDIEDRIDFQVNNRYEILEMVLCLGSFLLIPILILCILPMFPLHGIKEHIDVIGLLIFGILFYFVIGLKLIIKHSDKYYYKLLFNEDLSIIPPTKIETKWKKSMPLSLKLKPKIYTPKT